MEGATRTHDGATLAHWVVGDGRPTLLLSGQAVDHRSWARVVRTRPERMRLLLTDQRHLGASTGGDPVRSTRQLAEDAVAVLDGLGVESCDVVGHSFGGRVAQWLAIDHPQRVRRLVLAATSPGDRHGLRRQADADAALLSGDSHRVGPLFFDDELLREGALSLFDVDASRATRLAYHRASRRHDALDALRGVETPTLVVHGDADRVTDVSLGRALSDAMPRASLVVVRGGRHGVVVDAGIGWDAASRFLAADR